MYEPQLGQSAARNAGAGDVIPILDNDLRMQRDTVFAYARIPTLIGLHTDRHLA